MNLVKTKTVSIKISMMNGSFILTGQLAMASAMESLLPQGKEEALAKQQTEDKPLRVPNVQIRGRAATPR